MIASSIEEKQKLLKPCPVVYPLEKEFDNPIEYLSSPEIQKLGKTYGIIKLVPPKSWNPPFSLDLENFRFKPRVQQLSLLSLMNRTRQFFRDGLRRFMSMGSADGFSSTNSITSASRNVKLPKSAYFNLSNRSKVYYYDLFCSVELFLNTQYDQLHQKHFETEKDVTDLYQSVTADFGQLAIHLNDVYCSEVPNELIHCYNLYLKDYSIFLKLKQIQKQENSNKCCSSDLTHGNKERHLDDEYKFNENPYNDYNSDDMTDFENENEDEDAWCHICGLETDEVKMLICDGCDKGYHTYCMTPKISKIPKGKWFCEACLVGTGDYGFVMSDELYTLNEFQLLNDKFRNKYFRGKINRKYFQRLTDNYLSSRSEQHNNDLADYEKLYIDFLEREFWDNLVNNENSAIKVNYGADIHNMKEGQISGFPMNFPYSPQRNNDKYMNHEFNLTQLPFARGSLLNHMSEKISGMTIPWLYIGALFSTFCWHLEDHYMLSANYCHLGDIKKWYGIPESSSGNFEYYMKQKAPHLFEKQPDLLHQLVTLISPFELIENGVNCYYANQRPGEFVITFPKCYHAGFNCGFNVNEAVNFTNSEWLRYGINSLEDYKKFKKPAVFSQFQLCFNILKDFLVNKAFMLKQDESSFGIKLADYDMLSLCIAYLLKVAEEQFPILDSKLRYLMKVKTNKKMEIIEKEQIGGIDISRNCKVCDEFCDISHIEVRSLPKNAGFGLPPTPEQSPKNSTNLKRKRNMMKIPDDGDIAAEALSQKKIKGEDQIKSEEEVVCENQLLKTSKFCKIYEDFVKNYELDAQGDGRGKNKMNCYCLKHLENLVEENDGSQCNIANFEKIEVFVDVKKINLLKFVDEAKFKLRNAKIIDQ